jgi:phosphonate transport system ATP-binding protein
LRQKEQIGFIFQEFNLVGRLTALQNTLTGRLGYMNNLSALLGYFNANHREKALECLGRVHMLQRAIYRADNLSGGEKQRVAVARALAQEPLHLLGRILYDGLPGELSDGLLQEIYRSENPAARSRYDSELTKC